MTFDQMILAIMATGMLVGIVLIGLLTVAVVTFIMTFMRRPPQ
jgi:hypothetical protein